VVGRRLAWGKYVSCGQTCLAPDYIFCHESLKSQLIETIKASVTEFYGSDPQKSQDYSRIINNRHFDRLMPLLKNDNIIFGGKSDKSDLYIAPTIVDNVQLNDLVMEEEIFGPILPIVSYRNLDDVIEYVNKREKPLAVYFFSRNQAVIDDVMARTRSGGVTINDCILHMALETLPFGGVGNSGMGRYHGKYSFDCFTHEKAVLHRPQGAEKLLWMRYPPYDEAKFYWTKQMGTKRSLPTLWFIYYVPMLIVGFLMGYLFKRFCP